MMIRLRHPHRRATGQCGHATLLATLVAFATVLPGAQAQEAEESPEVQDLQSTEDSQFNFVGQGGLMFQGEADIDGPGGGTMEVMRFDAGVAARTPLSERLRWLNTFLFGVEDYDFDGGGFSAGDPWETILESRYGTQLAYRIDDQWGVRGGGLVMLSREVDADWGDSFTGGGTLGVDYRHSKTLFVSAGLGVVSQIEEDVKVIPMLALQWVPADHWAVRAGSVPVSGGALAGAEVAYQFAEQWELGLGVLYRHDRFRLDDSGPAPDGVGDEEFLPVRVRVAWAFHPRITLHFIGGVALGGELKLDDQNGNTLREEDYDPAPYLGVRVSGRF